MPFWLVQVLSDQGKFMWIYIIKIESNRLLATLYKDERVRERPELKKDGVSAILEKMYLGTLVKKEHVNLNLKSYLIDHIQFLGY